MTNFLKPAFTRFQKTTELDMNLPVTTCNLHLAVGPELDGLRALVQELMQQ